MAEIKYILSEIQYYQQITNTMYTTEIVYMIHVSENLLLAIWLPCVHMWNYLSPAGK